MKIESYYDKDLCCYKEIPEFPYPSQEKLLKIFPEAKDIIPIKLREWQESKNEFLQSSVKPILWKLRQVPDEFTRWFYREALKVTVWDELDRVNAQIQRLKRLVNLMQSREQKVIRKTKVSFEHTVEAIRATPILEVVSRFIQLRKVGRNYLALCPLHKERHPSFYVYPQSNSFYCFGCQKGGDVIKFVELYCGYDFKKAVEYLNGGR